ncbi:MAG: hypothetical protein ABI876_07370 [Bacteroidota bacterium]
MADTDSIDVNYRIHSIDVPHYMCTEIGVAEIGPEDIAIRFGWNIAVAETERQIACVGILNAFTTTDSPRLMIAFIMRCFFEVESLEGFPRNEGSIRIPDDFIITMLSVTYSTMRGSLYERLSSTVYRQIVLPPGDPVAMFEVGPTNAPIESSPAASTIEKADYGDIPSKSKKIRQPRSR